MRHSGTAWSRSAARSFVLPCLAVLCLCGHELTARAVIARAVGARIFAVGLHLPPADLALAASFILLRLLCVLVLPGLIGGWLVTTLALASRKGLK